MNKKTLMGQASRVALAAFAQTTMAAGEDAKKTKRTNENGAHDGETSRQAHE